jgi:mobilization protein MobC
MSISDAFHAAGSPKSKRKRPAPFSLRLTAEERARLEAEAKGAPLGAYVKAKVLETALPVRMRKIGLAVQDRQALAQGLALLGQSRLSNNLNQLAHAANIGALPLTPDVEEELRAALRDVRELRRLFLVALGLQAETRP